MKKNVLLLESVADEALSVLRKNVNVVTGYDDASIKHAVENVEIHAIITRGKMRIDQDLIQACPHLEAVARCGVGLDNVDVVEATKKKIPVINAPGSNAATIAEHTLALMLMLMRNMYRSVTEVKHDNWKWRNQYAGDELNGKTLGILGMGNIGKRVAHLGAAFGMEILYWGRTVQQLPYKFMPIDEILKNADIVSLHLPLEKDTDSIIGAAQLSLMKPDAVLINTARGALVDHAALLEALETGIIAGFAADVLPDEPPVQSLPIVQHPRALVTPHSASLTATTYRKMCLITVRNVLAVLAGLEPELTNVYNRYALYDNY